MASTTFIPDTTTLLTNPERGWYFSAAGMLDSNASFVSNLNILVNGTSGITTEPILLLHAYTLLPTIGLVSAGSLTNLTANFLSLRSLGVKAVVRLFYGNSAADPPLPTIQAQLSQLKPYFYAGRDSLYMVQCGLIGNYGEWANSANGNDSEANKNAILSAIQDMTPPEIPAGIRQPYFLQKQYPTAKTAANGFTGSRQARSSDHNDCFLTGDGDSSTFPGPATVAGMVITTTQAQQRAYLAADSNFVPYGGETCNNSSGAATDMRTACTDVADGSGIAPNSGAGGILNEGARYHLAYLNRAYAPNFPTAWTSGGCYNQVATLMGYRFQLGSLSHADTVARGSVLTVNVNLRNYGWARLFSGRQLQGRLVKSAATDITGTSPQQLRTLSAQATSDTTVQVKILIPGGATTGVYALHLEVPDIYSTTTSVRSKIRFANTNNGGQVWDGTNGRFTTGTTVTVT